MLVTVLVPSCSRIFFECSRMSDIEPIFYTPNDEGLIDKVGRKFGLRDSQSTMWTRLGLAGGREQLRNVYAMWLSPALYLPSQQIRCLIGEMPSLRWVYSQMAGVDHLDLDAFRERNIILSNNGNLSSRRVAEMILACIFAHAKRLPMHFALQQRRKWQSLPSDDLRGETVAILGTGNIGQEVAIMCKAVGLHVAGASRNPEKFGKHNSPYDEVVAINSGLDRLLAEADYVVVSVPLNKITKGMVGRAELRKMKQTACLISVARGEVVVESELASVLRDRSIDSAFIDRPSQVPLKWWSGLYSVPNLFITHYSATNSTRVTNDGFEQFVHGVRSMLDGGQPPNKVA